MFKRHFISSLLGVCQKQCLSIFIGLLMCILGYKPLVLV